MKDEKNGFDVFQSLEDDRQEQDESLLNDLELPNSFLANILTSLVNDQEPALFNHTLPFTCGVVTKARSGLFRIYRRSENRFNRHVKDQPIQLYKIVKGIIQEPSKMEDHYDVDTLWQIAEALTTLSVNLSPLLAKEFAVHPLYPLDPETKKILFHQDMLQRIKEYHDSIRRPEGTFDINSLPYVDRLKSLVSLERQRCPKCYGFRHIFCGPCQGVRMPNSEDILPSRIELPFDVLLLFHHQESFLKCTGTHVGAMAAEGQLSVIRWEKEKTEWEKIIHDLNPNRDVILFPYIDSIPADEFDWKRLRFQKEELLDDFAQLSVSQSPSSSSSSQKWRLVVLEASWGYGKTMANQIVDYRKKNNLPPIQSVILQNVTGKYWRFHAEGHSAVSTIEAIAHTALSAGCTEVESMDLLSLFNVQRYRVLSHAESISEGDRKIKAIEVSGSGRGDWKEVIPIDPITLLKV